MTDLKSLRGEELKRELARRANDEFTVFNPTTADFKLVYDGRVWLFPSNSKDLGHGQGVNRIPRYIAVHYMDKMSVHMMNEEYAKKMSKLKEKHRGDDWQWKEEFAAASREGLRTDNVENRKKYIKMFKIKLVRQFGLDDQTYSHEEALKPQEDRPIMDVLMEEMEAVIEPQVVEPVKAKDKLAESIAE